MCEYFCTGFIDFMFAGKTLRWMKAILLKKLIEQI